MADADLIAIRIKLLGGRQAASEAKVVNEAVAGTGLASKQAAAMTKRSMSATSAAFRKQAQMMQSTGRTMTYGLTAPLTLLGVVAVKTAADFTRSMAQVGVATGVGGRQLQQLKDYALEMGAKTIFSANEAAGAMLNLAKAGLEPAQITGGALKATMNLAAAGGLELAEAGNLVGASMKTFSLGARDSVQIADALAGGANQSAADVRELALSLSQAGQSAAMNKLTLSETVGTLAAMADQGLRGSDAGTSMKTFLMRLNPVTKKAKEEMANLGLTFFDTQGRFVGMEEVSRRLQGALGAMTDEQRNAAIQVLFGSDAQRAANIVYRAGPSTIREYTKATEEKGAAERMANAQMKGLPGALERAKGSLETAALVLGEALAPAIITVAGAVEGLANGFTMLPPEVQTTIAVVGTLAALAGPVLWFAGSMAKAAIAIRDLRTAEATGGGGLLGGSRKNMLARMGIGLAGTAAAQAGGSAVGGDLGNWISMAGTGAATGAMVGGAPGALVGATAGGVLAAVQKLSRAEGELTFQQQRLAESASSVKEWWGRQGEASRGLVAADERVQKAHKRAHGATDAMKQAQRHLSAVVSEYGVRSRPAIHAEARLTGLVDQHRRALKRLQNAERLRGVALSAYKTATNVTILAERHRINILTALRDRQAKLYTSSKQAAPQSERTRQLAQRMLSTEGKLSEATKKHAQTLSDAAAKGGQGYARFLQHASQESIRAGGQMKLLNEKATALSETFRRLGEQRITMPTLPGSPGPLSPLPETAGPQRPRGRNAAGTNFWGGGFTLVGERGPEVVDVPRGGRITAAPATRRLLAAVADPKPSSRPSTGGGAARWLIPVQVRLGKKVVAEEVFEVKEDAEARL